VLCQESCLLRNERYRPVAEERLELALLAGVDRRPEETEIMALSSLG
jgi:hypothetical protein